MLIRLVCPSGHPLQASESQAGQAIPCPHCGQMVIVPGSATEQPPPHKKRKRPPKPPPPMAGQGAPSAVEGPARRRRKPPPAPPPLPTELLQQPAPAVPSGPIGPSVAARVPEVAPEAAAQHQAAAEPPPVAMPPARRPALPPYRADKDSVHSARWLALIFGVIAAFTAAPALGHWDLAAAPDWARAALLVAALQVIYVLWMAAAPDWASLRVMVVVFAAPAVVYGAAAMLTLAAPADQPLPLGLGDVRRVAPAWCTAVMLLEALAAFLAGRYSHKWHRRFRLAMAGRRGG